MAISIIFTIFIAVLAGNIHKNKGYSFLTGFLWVFFFGLLGLLIVVLTKSKVVDNNAMNVEPKMTSETPLETTLETPQDNNPIK